MASPGLAVSRAPAEQALPLLAVVVIGRNEQEHIGACIEAVMRAVDSLDCGGVVFVDSNSTDRTVDIASGFPITVLRYRAGRPTAAAGRRIGFENVKSRFVLFVDGDCVVEPRFVARALDVFAAWPDAAVVYGARRDVTPGCAPDAVPIVHPSLGGNALYRSEALARVGSFNPFIVGEEEGELLGRLKAAGYKAVQVPDLMITHHTEAVQTFDGFMQRYRRGLRLGTGQVLRLSLGQGLFWYHARRLNRYLATLAYLFCGACAALASLLAGTAWPVIAWGGIGLVAFVALWIKRRDFRNTAYIFADWFTVALSIGRGFVRPVPPTGSFAPTLERLK